MKFQVTDLQARWEMIRLLGFFFLPVEWTIPILLRCRLVGYAERRATGRFRNNSYNSALRFVVELGSQGERNRLVTAAGLAGGNRRRDLCVDRSHGADGKRNL